MTLEKPPTTLGENQFESSSLFLENAFYREKIFQQKLAKQKFFQQANLSVFQLTDNLENRCTSCTDVRIVRAVVRTCTNKPRNSCPKNSFSLFAQQKSAFFCLFFELYGFAEVLPWYVCQTAASFSSLSRNLLCCLALLLPICSWKNEWPFPPLI